MTVACNEKRIEVVIPRGLLQARQPEGDAAGGGFSEDPVARRLIEIAAMTAVIEAELALGNSPKDVSAQKVGYDIASYDPKTDHLRFIEVKGRIDGADSVKITRQEVITSLHEPEKFIPATVPVMADFAHASGHMRGSLVERDLSLLETAIQFAPPRLLEWAEAPL